MAAYFYYPFQYVQNENSMQISNYSPALQIGDTFRTIFIFTQFYNRFDLLFRVRGGAGACILNVSQWWGLLGAGQADFIGSPAGFASAGRLYMGTGTRDGGTTTSLPIQWNNWQPNLYTAMDMTFTCAGLAGTWDFYATLSN